MITLLVSITLAMQPDRECHYASQLCKDAVAQTATHPDGRTKIIVDGRSGTVFNTPIDADRPLSSAEKRLIFLELSLLQAICSGPKYPPPGFDPKMFFGPPGSSFESDNARYRAVLAERDALVLVVNHDRGLRLGYKSTRLSISIGVGSKLFYSYRVFVSENGEKSRMWDEFPIHEKGGLVIFDTTLLAPGSYLFDFTIVYPSRRERQETVRFKDGETINLDWSK